MTASVSVTGQPGITPSSRVKVSQDYRVRVGTATASEIFQWIISPNLYHE